VQIAARVSASHNNEIPRRIQMSSNSGGPIGYASSSMRSSRVTASPPAKEEIEKLLATAPSYGIEIRLPGH
jgi:hypothetical protein